MEPPEGGRRRRAALLAVAGAVAVAVALAVAFSSATRRERPRSIGTVPLTQPRPRPGVQIGINVNRLFNGRAYSAAQIDAQLRDVAATGVSLARSDALWEAVEPRPPVAGVHFYDWSFDDLIAGSLAAHGIQWLPLLDYSASWAQSLPGVEHSPPRSAADFAAFAGAVAARYGAGGSFWGARPDLHAAPATTFEVWNEPDNPSFWRPAPDAARYAELYLAAREAIAAVDPSARVIIGGLSEPASFLPAMLAARPGSRGLIDGVAIHPYGVDPGAVLASVRRSRGTLAGLGLGEVPLYVTEFGWTTRPPGALNYAPADRRGGYISRTVAELGRSGCGIAAALLYTWITPGRDPANPQAWYGLRVGESRIVDQTDGPGVLAAGLRSVGAGAEGACR